MHLGVGTADVNVVPLTNFVALSRLLLRAASDVFGVTVETMYYNLTVFAVNI